MSHQLRIITSPHDDIANGTVGHVTETYKNDRSGMRDGWAVEVENKRTGKQIVIFVEEDAGELLPDTSGTAQQIAWLASWEWLAEAAHGNSRDKGFWDERDALEKLAQANGLGDYARNVTDSQLLALMQSELSEALEGERKNLMDDHCPEFTMLECELADVIIRAADMAKARGLRVGEALVAKMRYNATRERLHGKRF